MECVPGRWSDICHERDHREICRPRGDRDILCGSDQCCRSNQVSDCDRIHRTSGPATESIAEAVSDMPNSTSKKSYLCAILIAPVFLLIAGCGGGAGSGGNGEEPVVVSISISPTSVRLDPQETQTFTATVTGTSNTAVVWSIQEGSPAGGTFVVTGSSTISYRAPAAFGTYHVEATSTADPSKSAIAEVRVAPPDPPGD